MKLIFCSLAVAGSPTRSASADTGASISAASRRHWVAYYGDRTDNCGRYGAHLPTPSHQHYFYEHDQHTGGIIHARETSPGQFGGKSGVAVGSLAPVLTAKQHRPPSDQTSALRALMSDRPTRAAPTC